MEPRTSRVVYCARNRTAKTIDEHLACPYCQGRARLIAEDDGRKRFCSYDPATDPVSYGFPEETSRNRLG